jgi:hypothetical protein
MFGTGHVLLSFQQHWGKTAARKGAAALAAMCGVSNLTMKL